MGRVFVAGSINMDVVATADRHPKVGETVAGQAVHYFPGGKGANQAVAAAKLGAPTDADRPAGHGCVRPAVADVSRRARRRPRTRQGHRRISIPERRSSPSPMPTTPSSSCPAPTRWSVPRMSPLPRWPRATSPSASSKFRCPRSARSSNGRARPVRPRSSIRRRPSPADRSCLSSSTSWSSTRPSLGFLRTPNFAIATSLPASSKRRGACRRLRTPSSA